MQLKQKIGTELPRLCSKFAKFTLTIPRIVGQQDHVLSSMRAVHLTPGVNRSKIDLLTVNYRNGSEP